MIPPATFTFWIKRVGTTDTFDGAFVDDWGWRINLEGQLDRNTKTINGTGRIVIAPPDEAQG